MDEILEQLRWMLNLPLSATPEEIGAELDKLKARVTGANAASLSALLDSQSASVVALSAQVEALNTSPDPARFVALSVADGLRGEIGLPFGGYPIWARSLASSSGDRRS